MMQGGSNRESSDSTVRDYRVIPASDGRSLTLAVT